MNELILASHGGLAAGARDTLSMVLGDVPNVHVVSLARDDIEPITGKVQAIVENLSGEGRVYVLTDMLGSSVNNAVVEMAAKDDRITVISGMNMPLVLGLAMASKPLDANELAQLVQDSRQGIVDCSRAATGEPAVTKEETMATGSAAQAATGTGSTRFSLVRLDYRLLHGQVVFSWVGATGAQRIIVVDDEAANDELKKNTLKLAKPSGVRLNVFTLERALAKMPKLETLGENVMLIFGKTSTLLAFCKAYPKIREVNYGATANKPGATQYGGSIFLDESEQADTKALLDLGVHIFVQQTTASAKSDLTHL